MSEPSGREKLELGRIVREEWRFTVRTFFAPLRGAVRAMREQWDAIMRGGEDGPRGDAGRR